MQALVWKDAASDADSRRLLSTRSSVDLRQIRRAVGGPNNSSSERADPAAVDPQESAAALLGDVDQAVKRAADRCHTCLWDAHQDQKLRIILATSGFISLHHMFIAVAL